MTDAPILQMSGLHAYDAHGAIHGLSLALPAGPIGALVGTPSDGTTALAATIAGSLRPKTGRLTVAGRDPYASRDVRCRIGSLLYEPLLPEIGRVRDLLVAARKLRGGESPRDEWYEALGINVLERRSVATLDRRERRSVALALALAIPSPSLLVLHDPLADVVAASADVLGPILRARAEAGACVLLLSPSAQDASALADDVATIERGSVGRAIGVPDVDALAPGSPVELMVWCDMRRAMASALVLDPLVLGVSWSSSEEGGPMKVTGKDLESCARAVARVASANGVNVQALRPAIPSTPEINAATAGMVLAARHRAAYEATLPPRQDGQT